MKVAFLPAKTCAGRSAVSVPETEPFGYSTAHSREALHDLAFAIAGSLAFKMPSRKRSRSESSLLSLICSSTLGQHDVTPRR
jgi:hypothetical protein